MNLPGEFVCLLPSLTGSHSAVIAVVSFLILDKNSQTPLPSRAPSRLQSLRICKHNGYDSEPLIQWRIILFLRSVGLRCCVCAGAHAHKHTHSQAREYTCTLSTSFTDNCWLHWISGPCCIVGRSYTVAELGGPQVSGGHVIGVEPPYNPVG